MRITEITLRAHKGKGGNTTISGYFIDDENIIRDISAFKMWIYSFNTINYVMDELATDICESYKQDLKTEFKPYDIRNYESICGDLVRRYYI